MRAMSERSVWSVVPGRITAHPDITQISAFPGSLAGPRQRLATDRRDHPPAIPSVSDLARSHPSVLVLGHVGKPKVCVVVKLGVTASNAMMGDAESVWMALTLFTNPS